MRRALAILGLVLAVGGFIVLAVSVWLNIHFLIPVGMIFCSFIILTVVKKMPSDTDKKTVEGDSGVKEDE